MSESLRTPLAMRPAASAASAKFRAQAGRQVTMKLLGDEDLKLEGALRTASDEHVEFWSRVAWRQLEQPRPVMVSVLLEQGLWAATGIAHQALKTGAVHVVLDHPLVPTDRRRDPRYTVEWPATLLVGSLAIPGRTLDVSIGGLRFGPAHGEIDACVVIGRWVAMSIDIGGGGAEGFLGLAVVRATEPTAVRMEFADLPQRMAEMFGHAIRDQVRRGAPVQI